MNDKYFFCLHHSQDVCSNNAPVANLSPGGNKFMSNNDEDDDGSAAGFRSPHENGQRIKPFSPESHYKSQIFMQSGSTSIKNLVLVRRLRKS